MMGFVHPTQHDLDTWEKLGNAGWSYESCLPYLKGIESDQDFGDAPHHGASGPMNVKRSFSFDAPRNGMIAAVIDRAVDLGLLLSPDGNVANPQGVTPGVNNVKDGLRQSSAVAYLDRARPRTNLTIIADALVHSMKIVGRRVEEVVYESRGHLRTVAADQVILTAGVYHSPQILQLSGYGPASELERVGIKPVIDVPGVGANYQDHANVTMTFEGAADFTPDWVVPGFRLNYKSSLAAANADFHIFMRAPIVVEGLTPMMPVVANLIENRGRGKVRLASINPRDLPHIEDALLTDPDDLSAMTSAMQFISEFVQHDTLKDYYGSLIAPTSTENWADFARSSYDTYHHGVGTCMMGPASNAMAVVDSGLRAYGLDNLFVADASVMPTVTHANTNVTVMMIAERVAEFVH